LYTGEFFRFPHTRYLLEPKVIVIAVAVSLLAGLTGALLAVRQVVKMPPAEAMRPAAPAKYKKTLLERAGLFQFFSSSAKMVWREIERKPLRQLLSALGISMAVGIVMISGFMRDAISYLMQVQFHEAMREDVTVTFVKPLDERATRELAHIDGVHLAEGLSSVPVRFRSGHLYRDSALTGYQPNGTLRRILDSEGKSHPLPAHGVLLTQKLAELLGVKVGSTITVELKQGTRSSHSLYVGGLVDEPFGLFGHIRAAKLDQMLGAEPTVTTALLKVDPYARDDIEQRLKRLPWVLAVSSPRDFKTQFDQQSGQLMGIYTLILTLFASVIAVGVIYNNARVALSQRSRDLASLRVLGFQRSEISAILFGELSVQVLLALPLGMWIGHQMILGINSSVDPETYRLPIIVSLGTYAYAALVAIASAVLSALLVRRKISQLDMIAVLKTRE
jgi:putative ABC transport system permease protein